MPAATIKQRLDDLFHILGAEVVQLEASDEETYRSTRFASILAAIATSNENLDADLNVTFSGQVATINYVGATDRDVTLMLFGRP